MYLCSSFTFVECKTQHRLLSPFQEYKSARCLLLQDIESLFSHSSSADSQFMFFQWPRCLLSGIVGLGRIWLQFAGIVVWTHGVIINPLQGGKDKQAIILGAGAVVPALGLLCPLRECHSRWWLTPPAEEGLLSAWESLSGQSRWQSGCSWEEIGSLDKGACRGSSGS